RRRAPMLVRNPLVLDVLALGALLELIRARPGRRSGLHRRLAALGVEVGAAVHLPCRLPRRKWRAGSSRRAAPGGTRLSSATTLRPTRRSSASTPTGQRSSLRGRSLSRRARRLYS